MIFIRVRDGILDHLPIRRGEWIMTYPLIGMYFLLQYVPNMFNLSRSFTVLDSWADEKTWAILILACATARLAALTINGTFKKFRFSPHIRAAASLFCLFLWSQWTLGLTVAWLSEGGIPTGVIAYSTFCIFELTNFGLAFSDTTFEIKKAFSRFRK